MKELISHAPSNGLLRPVILAAVFFVFTAGSAYTASRGDASPSDDEGPTERKEALPQDGFLVLRGGQVLKGKISRWGDRYHVGLPYGEIIIRAVEVETCCGSLDEAYRSKRSLMHGGDVYGHVALAEWCLQNSLLDAAACELAAAVADDPQNPKAAHLERRLQAALNPPTPQKTSPGSMQTMPSRSELEGLSKSMPSGTMETFTSAIQPLLLNSCSTHDCHGPLSASRFRLLRPYPGRAPNRRMTQCNLHAVMEWIDRRNPKASPLLTKPIEPHGQKKSVIFDDTNAEQYRRLVNWVAAVVRQ